MPKMVTKKKVTKKKVAKKKPAKKFDPLDGFRARTDQDDQNEEFVRSVRGLSAKGISVPDIALVIDRDEVIKAINEDTILRRLVNKCTEILKVNAYQWSMSNTPDETKELHLESRAARMVIDWLEGVILEGDVAEKLIAQDDEVEQNE